MLMVIIMKGGLLMIRQTAKASTPTQMVPSTTAISKTISNTVSASKPGQTDPNMKAPITKGGRTELVCINGLTKADIKENGLRIESQVLVFTPGSMVELMKVNGSIIIWKVLDPTNGPTADSTKECTSTTRNRATAGTSGQMGGIIVAIGIKADSTA